MLRRILWLLALPAALGSSASCAQVLRIEPSSYVYDGQTISAEIGRFNVPELHARPQGPKIELAFLRLKSTAVRPGAPIIYLAGGPGGSGIDIAKGPRGSLFLRLRAVADVIALDPRGVGRSSPRLDCHGEIGLTTPSTRRRLLRELSCVSRDCARNWRAKGVDLSAYNIVESAHDIDALRKVLGVPQAKLWAASYGTQLGFAVLRHHGSTIERAVIAGVEGPDDTLKLPPIVEHQLDRLDQIIAHDPAVRQRYPTSMRTLANRVLQAADRSPILIKLPAVEGRLGRQVEIGRFDIGQALAGLIGTRAGMGRVAATLAALDRREAQPPFVINVAEQALAWPQTTRSAVPFLVDCATGASSSRAAVVRKLSRGTLVPDPDFPVPDVCPAWNVPPLPAVERSAARSPVPVLFFSGTLDGRTPPSNVTALISGFPNAHHVLIDGAGHGHDLFVGSPEIADVTETFFRDGTVSTDRIAMPPLQIQ